MTSIGKYAFSGCTGLTGITIPSSVTTIGESAFYGCTGLTSAIIGDGVTSIGESAFYGCTGMTSVIVGGGVTSIGESAFYDCSGLTGITIPSSVEYISSNAFNNCNSLQTLIIEDGEDGLSMGYNDNKKGLFSSCPITILHLGRNLYYTSNSDSGYSPFYNKGGLRNLTIGSKVRKIDNCLFYGCSGLTSIVIPNSVTFIGSEAFYDCSGLTSVVIPNSVTYVGRQAFYDCSGLTSVVIPNSVTSIGDNAFYGCSGLKKSAYPSSISNPFNVTPFYKGLDICYPAEGSYIGEDGCIWTENKTELYFVPFDAEGEFEIPSTVTTIGDNAFRNCTSLTDISIPESVTSIGDNAFRDCTSLTDISIPESVTSIGDNAFRDCTGLTDISIPESVTSIGDNAFYNLRSLTGILTLSSIKTIGAEAFRSCSGLTSVILGNSVTSIVSNAFYECSGLKKSAYPSTISNPFSDGLAVSYPAEGATVEDGVVWGPGKSAIHFASIGLADKFTVPASVTSIGENAFKLCDGLTQVETVNEMPATIAENSFDGLYYTVEALVPDNGILDYLQTNWALFKNLKGATSGVVTETFSDDVFTYRVIDADNACLVKGYYSNMSSVSIPRRVVLDDKFKNVTAIGKDAFSGCSRMTTLVLPRDLKEICEGAFQGCTGLTELKLSETVTTIGADAFNGCSGITALTLDAALTTIGDRAFSGCKNIASVAFNDNLETIGDAAFKGCTSIKSLAFNSKLSYLGSNSFQGCTGLTALTFNDNLSTIGDYAFEKCTHLTGVKFNNGLYTIGNNAFNNCTELADIDLPNTVAEIGEYAFANCGKLTSVSIPASVEAIGSSAFYRCSLLGEFKIEDSESAIEIGSGMLSSSPVENLYIGRDFTRGPGASGVKTLTIGNLVTEVPDWAFRSASSLATLTLGSSVKTIGTYAFYGCALTEVVMSPATETIGSSAFAGNDLKAIAIGANVTEIGEKVFDGANALTGVSITATTPPMANNNTFSYYDCPLYVTPGYKSTYEDFTRCWYRFSGYDLIPADNVEIAGQATITLKPGETMKLTATMTPANASLPYIFWRSTNPAFATVDKDGNVTLTSDSDISTYADDTECQIIAETLYADGPVATVTIKDDTLGVDDVTTNAVSARPNDIYNLQGICLKRDASQEDVDALAPGLYIIGGQKVLVK